MNPRICSRRHLLCSSSFGLGSIAASLLFKSQGLFADDRPPIKPLLEAQHFDTTPKIPPRPAKARAMISMFMLGGPSQIDLFDPKRELMKRDGEDFPGDIKYDNAAQASRKIMGPPWKFRHCGQSGMELSELVPHLQSIADEITLIRSMHTGVNNHLPSVRALLTGREMAGRATLGSWLTYGLGAETEDLPPFVALTHPDGLPIFGGETWGNGSLPSLYQGTLVRPKTPKMFNLDPPSHLKGGPQRVQFDLLRQLNEQHLSEHPGENDLTARISSYELAARMQLAATDAFDLSQESAATIAMYGIDQKKTQDYGTRCLIARRLVERGVRFVQIFNNGQSWDHHSNILKALPERCREIDQPAAALVRDLKQRGMLDSTLVHWGGEMGRLPVIQLAHGAASDQMGRDHNTFGFSMWTAGGGMKSGHVHGTTDEFSQHAVEDIVTHDDWLATVLHLFGLDANELKFRIGSRQISLVEKAEAKVVSKILA